MEKFNKELTIESHLRNALPRLGVDTVLDVGANEGQFATLLRYIGFEGEIISFEPSQAACATLTARAARDPAWKAHQLALGDSTGTAELNVSGKSVFSSLHKPSSFGVEKYGASIEVTNTETIQLDRLDSFLDQHLPDFEQRRVYLKMDTQGHDFAVMQGAGAYASRFAGLQSEISVTPIYEGVPDYIEAISHYRSLGYEVTGMFTVNRHRTTGHVIEFDCTMAPRQIPSEPVSG